MFPILVVFDYLILHGMNFHNTNKTLSILFPCKPLNVPTFSLFDVSTNHLPCGLLLFFFMEILLRKKIPRISIIFQVTNQSITPLQNQAPRIICFCYFFLFEQVHIHYFTRCTSRCRPLRGVFVIKRISEQCTTNNTVRIVTVNGYACAKKGGITLLGSPPIFLKTSVGKVSSTLTGTSSSVCLYHHRYQ